jgi:hypothetical protein
VARAMCRPETGDRARRALSAALAVYVEKVLGETPQLTKGTDPPDRVRASGSETG